VSAAEDEERTVLCTLVKGRVRRVRKRAAMPEMSDGGFVLRQLRPLRSPDIGKPRPAVRSALKRGGNPRRLRQGGLDFWIDFIESRGEKAGRGGVPGQDAHPREGAAVSGAARALAPPRAARARQRGTALTPWPSGSECQDNCASPICGSRFSAPPQMASTRRWQACWSARAVVSDMFKSSTLRSMDRQ
jgi:hypothetical protein